ncbi:MAG: PIG-L family deacetylase, partial [Pseudonocardia sp.]|nr:PIG-L family deacetylase [Pseudonocardia sp.]
MTVPDTRRITPPEQWRAALHQHRLPAFDPSAHRRVVVVAAHPDDETLGAGGVLRVLHAAGAALTLVVATDGEAAYPGLDAAARTELAGARHAELDAARRAPGGGGRPGAPVGRAASARGGPRPPRGGA